MRAFPLRTVAVASLVLASLAFAQEDDTSIPPKVLAIYAEGKTLYDEKNFGSALQQFDRCVDLEPARARWHYNRGLALKKLKRDFEAVEAFRDSLRLDPEYKKVEIGQKLSELGQPGPRGTGSQVPDWVASLVGLLLCMVLPVVGGVLLFRRRAQASPPTQGAARTSSPTKPPNVDAAMAALAQHQAPLERALAADDDPEGKKLVNTAGNALQFARYLALRGGDAAALEQAIARASAAVESATQHYQAGGGAWRQAQAERVGCFFCARPLAAPSARRGVALSTETGRAEVVACEACANKAASGAPLTVRVVGAGADQVHWAQAPDFDPYAHGYWGGGGRDVAPWQADLSGERLASVAPLVGLGAVAAGVAAVAVYDMMAAREAGLAAEAAAAAATAQRVDRSGGSTPRGDTWRDNS